MQRFLLAVLAVAIAFVSLQATAAPPAARAAASCQDGEQQDGAIYRICMPDTWNGQLIVYAHGFVDPAEPVGIPESHLVLPDGTNLVDIVTGLHFAFAMSSYSKNGLAILQGVDDSVDLVSIFSSLHGEPQRTFLMGVSEGGLVTTLGIERHPDVFAGGIAACGPIGSFQNQINYFGDMRVLFDYFFPGVIPGDPLDIPQSTIDNWDSTIEPAVRQALASNASARNQLITAGHVAANAYDPPAAIDALAKLLWYNVHATNDAVDVLGGIPFDNHNRVYSGTSNDALLNSKVLRVTADATAVANIRDYETTGNIQRPLVVMHTVGDEIVPYAHVYNYGVKLWQAGKFGNFTLHTVNRFGHCNFNSGDALWAFFLLLARS